MSDRGMSAAMLTEMGADLNRPFHLFEFHFDDEVVRITDAYRHIDWGGNNYIANGDHIAFDPIEESRDITIHRIGLSLSGVDQVWVATFLSKKYVGRTVRIYKGFFTAAAAVVVDPLLLFEGTMDGPSITEDPEEGTVVVSGVATNHFADWERLSGRHSNSESQGLFFPGDRGFEFVSDINRTLVWGGERIDPKTPAAPVIRRNPVSDEIDHSP